MLRLYVLTLCEAGLRCKSEALWLRWEDIDLDTGHLKIVTGPGGHRVKGGKFRWVALNVRLRDALRAHLAWYGPESKAGVKSEWVFHHLTTQRTQVAGERLQDLKKSFQAAKRRSKLPPEFRQHDLRHTRITRWIARGMPIAQVQIMAGHSKPETTMHYNQWVRSDANEFQEETVGDWKV